MRRLFGERPSGSRLYVLTALAAIAALFLAAAASASASSGKIEFGGSGSGWVKGVEPLQGIPAVECHWNGHEIDIGIPGPGECEVALSTGSGGKP